MGPLLNLFHTLSPYYEYHNIARKGGLNSSLNCFWYVYGALLQQGKRIILINTIRQVSNENVILIKRGSIFKMSTNINVPIMYFLKNFTTNYYNKNQREERSIL